jgi:hypothetical protein
MAIAFHPKYEYEAVAVVGQVAPPANPVYIVAADLLAVTAQKCGWINYEILARFPGARLEGAVFHHPFLERDSPGILADHVTLEQGTGAVHTAPGHGQEDYVVGRQYGLATYCRRPLLPRRRRLWNAARRNNRQNYLGSESHRHRNPARASRPARHRKNRTQLPALLALP